MRSAKFITGCLLAHLLLQAAPGWTQGPGSYSDPIRYGDPGFRRSLTATQSATTLSPTETGVSASDNIRGNGAKAGYTLSHGGIVPSSETVTVDGSMLRRDQDYYLDSASGMLLFTQPVRVTQTVRVSYRYVPEKDKERGAVGAPTMSLSFGPKTSMGITLAQTATNNSFDLLTYGANLKTELGGKSSMTNMMYVTSAQESGRFQLNEQAKKPAPKPKTDNLFVHNSDLQSGKLSVKLNYQDVGKDFSGFTALKQQKVTADDVLSQLEKEKGIQRMGLQAGYSLGKSASTGLNWSRISDEGGDVSRQSLSFGNDRSKVTAELQEISEGFRSFKQLTAAEQAALGNETGMRRMNLLGDFKLGDGLQLKTNYSQVETKDAGLAKYGMSLTGKQFSLSANYQDIDPNFSRIMDLADANKKAMAAEQGTKRYDLTAHLQASKSVTIDSFLFDSKHSTTGAFRKQFRNSLVIAPTKGPKLSILADNVSTGNPDASTDTVHQMLRLDHKIGITTFNFMHDRVTVDNSAGGDTEVTTQMLHFGTDPKRRASLIGDWKSISKDDGKFEETQSLKMAYKVNAGLDFNASRLQVRTDASDTLAQDFSLTGKVFRSIGLKSRFAQTEVDGMMTARTRELSLVPDAAKDLGMFKKFKWSVGFSEVEGAGKVVTQSKSAHIETNVMKHQVTADYAGGIAKDGQRPITRSFSVAGDPDSKKPVHYSFMYKYVDPGAAQSFLIRKYDLDWQISAKTKLTYNYFTYSEQGGKLLPIGGEKIRLTTPVNKQFSAVAQWETTETYGQDILKNTLSLGLTGKVFKNGTLEGSYGFDRVTSPSGKTTSRTYKLKYDHKVSTDRFLTFSGRYTDWSGPKPAKTTEDDLFMQLDLRVMFE